MEDQNQDYDSYSSYDDESSMEVEDKTEAILQETEELKERISSNPRDETSYLRLIEIYRSLGDADALRSTRFQFKQNLPLSSDVWTQWISDEIESISQDEEKESICHLFKSALKDYYSVNTWVHYLNYVSQILPSQMEEVAEEAIQGCAADCSEGLRIWAIILEWSKTNQEVAKTESYFKRMLSFPYASMQAAYDQYTQWHEAENTPIDPAVTALFEASLKEYQARELLESELEASLELDHITTAFRRFTDYTTFEITAQKKKKITNQPKEDTSSSSSIDRVLTLFDRYTYVFRLLPEFWHAYFHYANCHVRTAKILLSISNRALRHIACGPLYEDRLLALETARRGVVAYQEVVSLGLQQTFSSLYEYLHFLLIALATYRRACMMNENGAKEALTDFCSQCIDWLVGII